MTRARKRRQVALFAALAFALQSLLTFDVLAASAVQSSAVHIVTICSGDGFEKIVLDAQNQPVPAQHSHEECPACVLAVAASCGAPAKTGENIPIAKSGVAISFSYVPATAGHNVRVNHSRAPPEDQRF